MTGVGVVESIWNCGFQGMGSNPIPPTEFFLALLIGMGLILGFILSIHLFIYTINKITNRKG